MPTEYFEAKLLRAVGLGEFTAAIIPKGSDQQVKDILKKNGITDIREYKPGDKQDRIKKINDIDRVMFSRASLPDTINIDGVDRPTTNSEGKPIHPSEDGIRSFYKWFKNSKITDKQGRPLILYHGTKSDVATFDPKTSGSKSKTGAPEGSFFFTNKRMTAESYTVSYQGDWITD